MSYSSADGMREKLVKAAQVQWVNRLIDLTRRNNLLYYKPLLSGTLDLSLNDDLWRQIYAGEPVELRKLLPVGKEVKASSVRQIARKALENVEEKGLDTLYLAIGKATWPADDGGRPTESPVLLIPIVLKGHGQDVSTVTLSKAGDAEINPVLIHVIKTEFGIDIEGRLLPVEANGNGNAEAPSDASIDISALLGSLRELCTSVKDFGTSDFAVVGNFSFQKLAMVKDLQQRVNELLSSDIIAAIAGDEDARNSMSTAGADIDPGSLDTVAPENEFEVVEADSSQQCAIAGVAKGQCAVIHGPPGTGKSQTITNLIATLAAHGKKVLFVAEKRAALEVVLTRLERSGLEHLAIDLHGADLSAKKVMEKVARTLETVRESAKLDCSVIHNRFTDRRTRLNQHSQRMHLVHKPTEQSIFQMQAALLRLAPGDETRLRWRGTDLFQLTNDVINEVTDLLKDASGYEALFLRTDPSPWNGVPFLNGESLQQTIDLVQNLSHTRWHEWSILLTQVCQEAGLKVPTLWIEEADLVDLLDRVAISIKGYSERAFSPEADEIITTLERAKSGGLKALWLRLSDSTFRKARKDALAIRLTAKASIATLYKDLTACRQLAKRWTSVSLSGGVPTSIPTFENLRTLHNLIRSEISSLHMRRALAGWPEESISETKTAVDVLAADTVTPYKLLRLTEIEGRLHALGVQSLVDEFRSSKLPSRSWRSALRFAWISSTLDAAAIADPIVRGFVGATHSEYVSDFRDLDRTRLQLAPSRVKRGHAENAIAAMNAHPEQERLIRQEAAKSMRHRSIRRMFKEAGDVLTAVCPCWMASPLSVSQLIDGGAGFFDFVIFDEASQVLPEDAIPAILRAKHIVVAGDNKQLPPTTFFASDDEADISDEDDTATGYESLLDMMIPFVRGFHLNWHYRSRDESLIAFSNHHVYDDRLVTFPGPGGPPAIRHIAIDHIPDEDGQEASSSAEVARVVDLVMEHARSKPNTTLGVITMGIKHAQRIQGLLDKKLAQNRDIAEFFDTSRTERFFVKNLERVQGDERDSIIISVGYGKDRAGNLPLRFGPILYEGGTRRLNVAVTRARKNITVVSSFVWSDIDAGRVRPGSGLDFLRNYLQYAASDGKVFARGELTNEPMNDFEADVAAALSAKGIQCVPQVGCSKFRIDLAALHPTDRGRFVLAIECDGATYHSSYTARDRDRLRQQQLENLGWTFHRIWSTDWFLRKDEELNRVVIAYQRTLEGIPQPNQQPLAPNLGNEHQATELLRASATPPIQRRSSIEEYSSKELQSLIAWVNSDGRLRSNDEIADEMFEALPFNRRGSRIEATLRREIAFYDARS